MVLFMYKGGGGYYSHIWVLFIRRQEILLDSSVGVIEVDHLGTQHSMPMIVLFDLMKILRWKPQRFLHDSAGAEVKEPFCCLHC